MCLNTHTHKLSHTHTRTHTRTNPHTHTHKPARAHTHTDVHSETMISLIRQLSLGLKQEKYLRFGDLILKRKAVQVTGCRNQDWQLFYLGK